MCVGLFGWLLGVGGWGLVRMKTRTHACTYHLLHRRRAAGTRKEDHVVGRLARHAGVDGLCLCSVVWFGGPTNTQIPVMLVGVQTYKDAHK